MHILGIMGSPRIRGNTDLLTDAALNGARRVGATVEKILPSSLSIAPCAEYYGCLRDGECVIRDDMDTLYDKLLTADRIIVASPMFFYGLSAQLKGLIDRCQALWARKYILKQEPPDTGRKGAFIAVGATKGEKLFEGSILTVRFFFKCLGVAYADELLIRGVDKKGEIKDHPTALADAFSLGKKLIE